MGFYNIDKTKHYWALLSPVHNVYGFCFTSSNDPVMWVECEVDESRYKVDDNYKITLKSLNPIYGKENYYQSDFVSLLNKGFIVEAKGQKPVKVVEREYIGGGLYIENSGYVLE